MINFNLFEKIKNIFRKKYRIVTDEYCGYEVQYSYFWMPFWSVLGIANSHYDISSAEKYIADSKFVFKSKVIKSNKEICNTLKKDRK